IGMNSAPNPRPTMATRTLRSVGMGDAPRRVLGEWEKLFADYGRPPRRAMLLSWGVPHGGDTTMLNSALKDAVLRVLPRVKTPAQYTGGELNSVPKDHRHVRGKLCLCFPDAYTLGMSHHGLQVLYTIMNADPQWACERAFTPGLDFEELLRRRHLPLYSLETFTPLRDFDLLGFSLQYEICYTNILTMLDLGGVPLHSQDRTLQHPLVIAGGPGAQNPELLAPFIDLFVIGDGEESLPR